MTLSDLVNTLTGQSFSPTQVTNANTVASNIATGLRGSTYTFAADDTVDSGVAMLSARILDRGRADIKSKTVDTPPALDSTRKLVTTEIRDIIIYDRNKFDYTGDTD